MKVRNVRKVLFVLVVLVGLCMLPVGAVPPPISCTNPSGNYNSLDVALQSGSTACTLISDVNSTLKAGNLTVFNHTMSLTSQGFRIFLNNTVQFNGTGVSVTFADPAWFVYDNSPAGRTYLNNSLIEVIGSTGTIQSGSVNKLDLKGFSGTGINISGGPTNTLSASWNITSTAQATAFNIFGRSNTLNWLASNVTTAGFGVNISGTSNTIYSDANNITAPLGIFVIVPGAKDNTITDLTQLPSPNLLVYNSSSTYPHGPGIAWFFFNSTQSSGGNMNVTLNISNSIPFVGNVSILANTSSVSSLSKVGGGSLQNWTNSTLSVVNGNSGGLILNTTSNVIFGNGEDPTFVGVYYSVGPNTVGVNGNTYYEFVPLNLPAVFLNGNPSGKVPMLNKTCTTNFTKIDDFSNTPLTFVMENQTTHQFLANITFTAVNMTDRDEATAIKNLGQSLMNKNAGNRVGFNMSVDAATKNTFNISAIIRTYPNAFTFTSKNNVKLSTIPDLSTTSTSIWDGSGWVGSASDYVDTGIGLVIGTDEWTGQKYIEIHSKHFSSYDSDENTGGGGGSSGGGDGGGSDYPTTVATPTATQTPGTPTTIGVNVGGSSAISKVAVTGTGVNDLIVTALPHSDLTASITRPATTVYQYMTITPARYTTISSVTFNFNVPASWLADKGYTKNDIVLTLWDPDAKTWTTLPTSIISENQGVITYQATAPHMSEFAIVYQKGAAAQAQANVTAIQTSVPLTTTMAIVTTVPTTRPATPTSTKTVAPAPTAPPTGGFPTTTIVIAVVAIIIIVAAAFLAHRWWIRKQNPALFKDLK